MPKDKKDRSSQSQGIENKVNVDTSHGEATLDRDETDRLQQEAGRAKSGWPKVSDVVVYTGKDGRTESNRAFIIGFVHPEGTRDSNGRGKAVGGHLLAFPGDAEFDDGKPVYIENIGQGNPGEPGTWHKA